MKKLRFITLPDKQKLDEHIIYNCFHNIADIVMYARRLGYKTSRTAIHRYMQKLKECQNERY